ERRRPAPIRRGSPRRAPQAGRAPSPRGALASVARVRGGPPLGRRRGQQARTEPRSEMIMPMSTSTSAPLLLDHLDTPIGRLAVVATLDGRLRATGFVDGHTRMDKLLRDPLQPASDPGGLTSAIGRYFAGDLRAIDGLPVVLEGTDFQRTVWRALL